MSDIDLLIKIELAFMAVIAVAVTGIFIVLLCQTKGKQEPPHE